MPPRPKTGTTDSAQNTYKLRETLSSRTTIAPARSKIMPRLTVATRTVIAQMSIHTILQWKLPMSLLLPGNFLRYPTFTTSIAAVDEPKSPDTGLPQYVLDSATSITMNPTHIPFHSYQPSHTPVTLADQRTTPAIGEGYSAIPTMGRLLQIPRALRLPHLHDHLVSATKVSFHNDILLKGPKVYILQRNPTPEPSMVFLQGR
jgi:hypothetical protein